MSSVKNNPRIRTIASSRKFYCEFSQYPHTSKINILLRGFVIKNILRVLAISMCVCPCVRLPGVLTSNKAMPLRNKEAQSMCVSNFLRKTFWVTSIVLSRFTLQPAPVRKTISYTFIIRPAFTFENICNIQILGFLLDLKVSTSSWEKKKTYRTD